jgi:hypothetical protein
LVVRTFENTPVGRAHHQAFDMRAEGTIDVMTLAVNVCGHHAAEGDVLRAGCDRCEPIARQRPFVQAMQ